MQCDTVVVAIFMQLFLNLQQCCCWSKPTLLLQLHVNSVMHAIDSSLFTHQFQTESCSLALKCEHEFTFI